MITEIVVFCTFIVFVIVMCFCKCYFKRIIKKIYAREFRIKE